jgi:hypothetical protein
MAKRKLRRTAKVARFQGCMRKKLKGRRFSGVKTARKALGAAARACGRVARGKKRSKAYSWAVGIPFMK